MSRGGGDVLVLGAGPCRSRRRVPRRVRRASRGRPRARGEAGRAGRELRGRRPPRRPRQPPLPSGRPTRPSWLSSASLLGADLQCGPAAAASASRAAGSPSRCARSTSCAACRRPSRPASPATPSSRRCGGHGRTRSPRWCGPASVRRSRSASTSRTRASSGGSNRRRSPASRPGAASRRRLPDEAASSARPRRRRDTVLLVSPPRLRPDRRGTRRGSARARVPRSATARRRRPSSSRTMVCGVRLAGGERARRGAASGRRCRSRCSHACVAGAAARGPRGRRGRSTSGRCCSSTSCSTTDRYTPFDAHYLPEEWTPVTRVSEPKNYRDGDDPPGRTVLCAEIPCGAGDALWSASDDELGRGRRPTRWRRAGLPRAAPVEVVVRRLPSVYPVYALGFERRRSPRSTAGRRAQPRLLTFGRLGPLRPRQHPPRARDGMGGGRRAARRRLIRRRCVGGRARARSPAHVVRGLTRLRRLAVAAPRCTAGTTRAQVAAEPHERPPLGAEAVARSAPRRSGSPWRAGRA